MNKRQKEIRGIVSAFSAKIGNLNGTLPIQNSSVYSRFIEQDGSVFGFAKNSTTWEEFQIKRSELNESTK